MIKKIFLGVLMMLICDVANANIYIDADVAKQVILSHIHTDYQVPALQEYNAQLKASGDSTMSANGLYKVCVAAGWDITQSDGKNKCNNFVQALLEGGTYTYYEVCGNDKGKSGGTEHCIEDVFYALVNGVDVQITQAIELSKEYALVKHNDDIECSNITRKGIINPLNDYIKCTSKLTKTYYEFKFDDINQSTDQEIHKDTLRAIGNIHGIEFRDSGCSLERIVNDSGCAVGYNTVDTAVCERLSKSLGRFGMESTVRNVSYSLNNTETFCVVKFVTNTCTAATDYGLSDTVFQEIQYPLSPTLENYVKDYVMKQLTAKGINLSSFRCDKTPKYKSTTMSGMHVLSGDILTCYLNDKCINFVFEDLSESANYSKNAALSRLACLMHGGQSDGTNCRGLDEAQCATLGEKIKTTGHTMGTHYDRVRGGCILDGAVTENIVNLVGEIAAGVALTLVTDGAALVPVVVSIGTDLAFTAVQDWQRKIPYNDYQDFLAHVMMCSEDSTGALSEAVRISNIKSVENKYCLSETIRQDYQLVVGQMSLLAPEDQKILSNVFTNIVANIGNSEYIRAASESEISLLKQGRNLASGALLAGLFFIQPEKMISKFDNVAHNIARLRYGASKNFTKYLDDFKRLGTSVGLPIGRLSMSEWQALNNSLIDDGVELFQDGQYMRFRKLAKIIDINELLRRFNKTPVFRPAASNSLGRDYYRVVINDTDDVDNIIKTLQNNGFYVSANQTVSGEKFIGVSTDDIFGLWDDAPTNWLKTGRNMDNIIGNEKHFANHRLDKLLNYTDEPLVIGKLKGHDVFIDPKDFGQVSERPIIMVSIADRKIPFYISTGTAGKITVPTGKWEFFGGIDPITGWFNKGSLDDINSHYGVYEFKQIADMLDQKVGDVRNVQLIAESNTRAQQGGQGMVAVIRDVSELDINNINQFFAVTPSPNGFGDRALRQNIADLQNWFNKL
jgi:hypothetical protein